MNIFVDESGSFVPAYKSAWCVIAAYASPESDRRALEQIVRRLRPAGYARLSEIKFNELSEPQYFPLLRDLGGLKGVLFAAAIDMGYHDDPAISTHKLQQAAGVVAHISKLKHARARADLNKLSAEIAALPNQLYAQLMCQTALFSDVLNRGILYFVQRQPQTVREIRWRLDRKNTSITRYEDAFKRLLSESAIRILSTQPHHQGNELVFPAPRGGQLSDMSMTAVMRRMEVDAVPHGFRSTFRDWSRERTSFPRDLAEQALAHALDNKVEAAYRRGDALDKRREMMEAWDKFCADDG